MDHYICKSDVLNREQTFQGIFYLFSFKVVELLHVILSNISVFVYFIICVMISFCMLIA